jgi:L-rhamnose mutarotase
MRRLCYALDLKNEPALIEAYKAWHAPKAPPAAVTQAIRAAGVESLQIFLTGNRLYMLMEVTPRFSAEAKAAADALNPEVQAWEKLMWDFQQALPWAKRGQKWVPAELIYDLAEQP